jgi:hypothetical protein
MVLMLDQRAEQRSSAAWSWSAVLWLYLGIAIVYHGSWEGAFSSPAVQNWATILVSLTLQ